MRPGVFAAPRRRLLRGALGLLGSALAHAACADGADSGEGSSGAAVFEAPRAGPLQQGRALAFGTRVGITVAGLAPEAARRAIDAALAEIAAVDAASRLFTPEGELARLNREGRLAAPGERLRELLGQAQHWGAASGGAFDVSVQPLWRLYFAASARGELPSPAAIAARREAVDWRGLRLDAGGAAFDRPGMQLTLNGLAQGLASDRAWAVLRAHGVRDALVDAGEWRAAGQPEAGRPWRLGIRRPGAPSARPAQLLQAVELRDRALSSSGDDGLAFSADRREHHILDPRSGHSPRELAAVSVLAPDAVTADALSTACMVLGLEAGRGLVASLPGVEALFVTKRGQTVATPGWPV